MEPLDTNVVRDARRMLERAARLLESMEHAYMASAADEAKYAAKLSEALANIHAAEARLR